MFLGKDLPIWLLLAIGAALAAGNAAALLRPQDPDENGEVPPPPPLGRSLVMITIGSVAALAALVTLLSR